MKKIFKYLIEPSTKELDLPVGSKILSVINQRDSIVLYAVIDTDIKTTRKVSVCVVGTGHEILFDLKDFTFLGTVSLYSGELIFHVYYQDRGAKT